MSGARAGYLVQAEALVVCATDLYRFDVGWFLVFRKIEDSG